jgi:acyl-CoA synthetase (AMP-forming)/AMP-acid ligase II
LLGKIALRVVDVMNKDICCVSAHVEVVVVVAGDCQVPHHTSGSTAEPEGVMVSHRNLTYNLAAIAGLAASATESQGVSWLPPYHDMGLIGGILEPLYAGFPVRRESLERFSQKFGPCGFRPEAHQPACGLAEATLLASCSYDRKAPEWIEADQRDLANGRLRRTAGPPDDSGPYLRTGDLGFLDHEGFRRVMLLTTGSFSCEATERHHRNCARARNYVSSRSSPPTHAPGPGGSASIRSA